VLFWQPTHNPVHFGAGVTATFDWQSGFLKLVVYCPVRRCYQCHITERLPSLGLYFWKPKFCGCHVPFTLVAVMTGNCQVVHPIRPVPHFGDDLLDFQQHVFGMAITTFVAELLKQVFAHFVPVELPLMQLTVPQFPAPDTPVLLAVRKSFLHISPVIQDTEPDNCSALQCRQPGMPAGLNALRFITDITCDACGRGVAGL